MYNQITENQIEQFAIEILQSLGWDYVFGPDIAPDSQNLQSPIANRKSLEDVLLYDILGKVIKKNQFRNPR